MFMQTVAKNRQGVNANWLTITIAVIIEDTRLVKLTN